MLPVLPFSREAASDALSNSDTFGTVIHLIVLSAYGQELYGDAESGMEAMDPIELYARIKEDFRTELTEEGENKLQALMLAVSTDAFFDDKLAFLSVAQALVEGDLGDLVNGVLEEVTVPEVLWSVYEILLNRDDSPEFSPAITREIQSIVAEEADENDSLEVGEVIPYYQKFVDTQKLDLIQQLTDLGLDQVKVSQFVNHKIESQNQAPTGAVTP